MDLLAHFGMHKPPFTREIQPEEHLGFPFADEAFEGLLQAVSGRMSCALISPAGTGKTALLRRLRGALPEARYHVRYVKVTSLSKRDMCREIAAACGLTPAGTYPSLVRKLQQHWDDGMGTDGVRPVLILDEGHDLRPDVLAILRILTNFDMDSRLVLSVILAGQPPLGTLLSREHLDAVAQRLAHYATLRLLSRDESTQYIEHRCAIALVHHMSKKARAQLGQALRGSSDLFAWADSNAYLVRHARRLTLSVEHRSAPSLDSAGVALIDDDPEAPHLEIIDDGPDDDTPPPPLADAVLQTLRQALGGPLTRAALRQQLRVNNKRLGDALADLERRQLIRRTPQGWTLTPATNSDDRHDQAQLSLA